MINFYIYIYFHTIITVVVFVTISNAILDHGLSGLNANGASSSNAELMKEIMIHGA